jgi:hypothetical protein
MTNDKLQSGGGGRGGDRLCVFIIFHLSANCLSRLLAHTVFQSFF